MQKVKAISPFRLSSLLRLQKDPISALELFLNPNPDGPKKNSKPFRHSPLSYDLIIAKLGRAKLFLEMERIVEKLKDDKRILPEEVIFCNIITYYGRGRMPDKAIRIFQEIPSFRCERTIKSANTLLSSLLICREFGLMRNTFSWIVKHASPDACTYNILINACFLRSYSSGAWEWFDEMQRTGCEPNLVTFGTLINGLCGIQELEKAFSLKRWMETEMKIRPNVHIYVALIKGLCKVNDFRKAIDLKDEMMRKQVSLDPGIYSTLISAFFKVGRRRETFELLEEMKLNGCKPDTVTYNAIIHGYCQDKEIDSAFRTLTEMEKEGCKPDLISYNVIIGGLCRDGRVGEAKDLLDDMPRLRCPPDAISYRMVFDGFCGTSDFKEAADLLDEMIYKGYVPCYSSLSNYLDILVQGKHMEGFSCRGSRTDKLADKISVSSHPSRTQKKVHRQKLSTLPLEPWTHLSFHQSQLCLCLMSSSINEVPHRACPPSP